MTQAIALGRAIHLFTRNITCSRWGKDIASRGSKTMTAPIRPVNLLHDGQFILIPQIICPGSYIREPSIIISICNHQR